jgi:hypothetical protein
MDILKILGQKDAGGNIPLNVKIALDPTVNQAIKTGVKGFSVGMGLLALGIIGAAAINRRKTK